MNRPASLLIATAAILFFTSSFDVFLTVSIGPTLRIAQIFTILLLAVALLKHRLGLTMEMPLGAPYLIVWWGVQLAFVPVAAFWQKSMAYCMWLGLSIALCFAMVNLFGGDFGRLQKLLKLYLFSYVFVAGFGIVQFLLPLAGGPGLLVEQWWILGRVPRVNGFSYEPSYYATYLLMGLVCLGSMRRSGIQEFRTRAWTCGYLLMVCALVVCASRTGLVFCLIELSITPIKRMWRVIRSPRLVLGFRISGWKILGTTVVLWFTYSAVAGVVRWVNDNPDTIRIVVAGTGLLGTPAHSVVEREDHFQGTLQIIQQHPWMGRSLGGITESIASYSGVTPMNFEETKSYEGLSVFAEVVAASGLIGSIPFLCFLVITIVAPLRLAGRILSMSPTHLIQAAWLRALVQSLIFEWAILQFNQNILRLYLWVHIAVLTAVFAAVQRQYGESGVVDPAAGGYDLPNLLA